MSTSARPPRGSGREIRHHSAVCQNARSGLPRGQHDPRKHCPPRCDHRSGRRLDSDLATHRACAPELVESSGLASRCSRAIFPYPREHRHNTPHFGPRGPLPPRARAGPGRHGHGLPRPRPPARPEGRAQGAPARALRGPRRRAVPRRDQDHRQPRSIPTSSAVRLGRGRRPRLLRDAVRRGREPPRPAFRARSSSRWRTPCGSPARSPTRSTTPTGTASIHRDIKPENILLHDGRAMVADFGIALAAARSEGGSRMTETGMSLGTPHYMSPEQAMGEREITAKSDVYALGCVLYEMLTGEPPFTGPTAQAIIARVMTEEPRSLTIQRKTIPPHVEAAVVTALVEAAGRPVRDRGAVRRGAEPAGRDHGGDAGRAAAAGAARAATPRARALALAPWALALLALAARRVGLARAVPAPGHDLAVHHLRRRRGPHYRTRSAGAVARRGHPGRAGQRPERAALAQAPRRRSTPSPMPAPSEPNSRCSRPTASGSRSWPTGGSGRSGPARAAPITLADSDRTSRWAARPGSTTAPSSTSGPA